MLRPHPDAMYKDSFDAFKSAARSQDGLKRLWRGVWSVVIGAGPAHALYFGSYEQAKKILVPAGSDAASSPVSVGLSGAIATSLADGFMTPFDVIKQRMQVHDSPFKSVYRCGLEIFRREGLSAFFISYPTTLFLNIPFQMVQFPTYEFLRKLLHRNRDYDPVSHIVSGGLAGGLAAALTTPIDVVKTALQTRGLSMTDAEGKLGGMKDAVKLVYRERGWSGFARGLGPRMLTHMPATAICWGFYEYLKSALELKY